MSPMASKIAKAKMLARIRRCAISHVAMRKHTHEELNTQSPGRLRPDHILGIPIHHTQRLDAPEWELILESEWTDADGEIRSTINWTDVEDNVEADQAELEANPLYGAFG